MKIVKIVVKIEDELAYAKQKWFTVRLPNNSLVTLRAEDCQVEELLDIEEQENVNV